MISFVDVSKWLHHHHHHHKKGKGEGHCCSEESVLVKALDIKDILSTVWNRLILPPFVCPARFFDINRCLHVCLSILHSVYLSF